MLNKVVADLESGYARLRAPGQIQGFGAMLVLHPATLRVLSASENAPEDLGVPRDGILGMSILDIIEPGEAVDEIQASAAGADAVFNNPIPVIAHGQRHDLMMHRNDGVIFAEFERLLPGAPCRADMDRLSDDAIMGMMVPGTMEELLAAGPAAIRSATGFDRVLVYRFDDAFRGQVVGEARRPGVDSFLGMFFPETDIGGPARELYIQNFSRYIPAIGAPTSRLEPSQNPLTDAAFDMSQAVLRAVAPCHVDYLANMGVSASMSFSIVSEGRLWGLFACHHYSPSQLSFTQRLVCEQIAMMFVAKLADLINPLWLQEEMISRRAAVLNFSPLFSANPLKQSWSAQHEMDILRLVNAEGAVIYINGEVGEIGPCPDMSMLHAYIESHAAEFKRLMYMYDDAGLFYTNSVASNLSFGGAMREKGSGVLIIPLSRTHRDFLFWFRPELVVKATWAGNPSETKIKDMNAPFSPRRSFAAWKEDIRDRAEPWSDLDIANAIAVRDRFLAMPS